MLQQLRWHSPALMPIAIGASLLIVAVVLWVYWPQMRLMRGPWRWLLPSLRGVALVAVAIAIMRPVVVRPRSSAERGAIVLLVDRSPSMGIVDGGRTPAQLVVLADGLRMLPEGIRPASAARLDDASANLRELFNDLLLARGQLDYARISGQSTENAEQRLLETARRSAALAGRVADAPEAAKFAQQLQGAASNVNAPLEQWTREVGEANDALSAAIAKALSDADHELYDANAEVRQACDELADMSRLDIVSRALTWPRGQLLTRLLEQAPVFGFEFSEALEPVALQDERGQPVPLPTKPSGVRSDLTGALRAAREKMRGQPMQAIVMFSDGRQVGSGGDLNRLLFTAEAPIFTVDSAGPVLMDFSIARLSAPTGLLVGQSSSVRAGIRAIGAADTAVDVILDAGGTRQIQRIDVPEDRTVSAEFSLRFDNPGEQSIAITVAPQAGETTAQNNRIVRPVNVLADKVKVLAISGFPGWDFQYLVAALERSPFIELQSQILVGESPKLNAAPEQILRQDVIVLSDARADAIAPAQWSAIVKLVNDRGGSVIVIPGDPRNLLEISKQPGIAALLPFRDAQEAAWRVWPGEGPYFQLGVAPEADNSDALRLSDDPDQIEQRWDELAAIFRFMPVPDPQPGVQPLLIERDSELPVLTEQQAGAGRAFFFGARETWRWRYRIGGRDQDRFWLQLVRHAARPRAAGSDVEVTQESLAELANVSGDEARLRRIAAGSGGEMLRIEEIGALPERIRRSAEKLPRSYEYPIWNSGYLFVFVVGCLGAEWALRKRAGMV